MTYITRVSQCNIIHWHDSRIWNDSCKYKELITSEKNNINTRSGTDCKPTSHIIRRVEYISYNQYKYNSIYIYFKPSSRVMYVYNHTTIRPDGPLDQDLKAAWGNTNQKLNLNIIFKPYIAYYQGTFRKHPLNDFGDTNPRVSVKKHSGRTLLMTLVTKTPGYLTKRTLPERIWLLRNFMLI